MLTFTLAKFQFSPHVCKEGLFCLNLMPNFRLVNVLTITGAVEEEASFPSTVEPRYNEFRAKGLIKCVRYARFRYIKVLFHTFYYY